jgi:hypothetical protein
VLRREHAGEILAARVEELADREEELRALRERRRAPGLERLGGVRHDRVDLGLRRQVDGARLHAARRVVDRPGAPGGAVDALPSDPVGDPRDLLAAAGGGGFRKLRHGFSPPRKATS